MGNLGDYKKVWSAHRSKVKRIRREYDDASEKLSVYQGSGYWTEHQGATDARFNAELHEAQQAFREEINGVLVRMSEGIEGREQAVVAPTPDMLSILDAVDHMTTLSLKDYVRFSEAMQGNQVALQALHDLAVVRVPDGTKVPDVPSAGDAARAQLRALRDGASALGRWDGVKRGEALRVHLDNMKRRGDPRFAGNTRDTFDSAAAGDIDPTSPRFFREVIGMLAYNEDSLPMLD